MLSEGLWWVWSVESLETSPVSGHSSGDLQQTDTSRSNDPILGTDRGTYIHIRCMYMVTFASGQQQLKELIPYCVCVHRSLWFCLSGLLPPAPTTARSSVLTPAAGCAPRARAANRRELQRKLPVLKKLQKKPSVVQEQVRAAPAEPRWPRALALAGAACTGASRTAPVALAANVRARATRRHVTMSAAVLTAPRPPPRL